MLIEEFDGPGPGNRGRRFMMAVWVGVVHERVTRALVGMELKVLAQALKFLVECIPVGHRRVAILSAKME